MDQQQVKIGKTRTQVVNHTISFHVIVMIVQCEHDLTMDHYQMKQLCNGTGGLYDEY